MGVALPNTNAFDTFNNPVDKGKYQALCKEFGLKNPDFLWKGGPNGGLGDVYIWKNSYDGVVREKYNKWPNDTLKLSENDENKKDKYKNILDQQRFIDFYTRDDKLPIISYIKNTTHKEKQHEWFALRKGKGITKAGLGRLNRSIEAFVYCVLGAQANVRNPIVGDGGGVQEAQQEMLILFESAVIEEDISKSISRYQLTVQNAKVKLDFAITPGTWLLPSELVINTGRVDGYNNKLQKATDDMKFGVNDSVNKKSSEDTNTKKDSSQSSVKTDHAVHKSQKQTITATKLNPSISSRIHEEKLASIAVVVGGTVWWFYKTKT